MASELFYVEDFYIVTKHKENWKAVKGMLDLPIWKRATEEPKDRYKEELKKRIKNIQKKGLSPEKKIEEIKELKKKLKLKHEIATVRTTYRTFLKAMGDLICERGNPPALTGQSILSKFEELANEEYDDFLRRLKNVVKKQIKNKEFRKKEIEKCEKKVEAERKEHFYKLKHIKKRKKSNKKKKKTSRKQKEGLDVKDRIDRLNTWLNKYGNATFVKRVGTDFKLLVYRAEGEGEHELFCSDKNKDKFLEIIDEMGRKKGRFEEIEYIKPFENVLSPSSIEKIEYFRDLGPLSVHFENGWMYRRREVNELEKRIKNTDSNNVQLLTGNTASGKTVIARYIGYDLWKEDWKVYEISIYDLVDESKKRSIRWGLDYLENIANKVLVIIEDVHRESDEFTSFLEWILNKYSKTRFLLTAMEPFDIGLMREEKSVFKRCERKKLEKEIFPSIADSIITTYKNKQIGDRKEDLDKFAPKDRRMVKKIADGDLWLLAYALDAWMPDKGINMDIIYDKINEDIIDLDKEFKTKHGLHGVSEVLLTLAPFSLYEVGVSKSFLKGKSGIIKTDPDKRDKLLDKLVEYDKIIEENGLYLIPHSTHARLYLGTAMSEAHKDLLSGIIPKLENNDSTVKIQEYPLEIIKAYILTRPDNFGKLILEICKQEIAPFEPTDLELKLCEESTRVSIRKLLLEKKFLINLTESLNKSDFGNITNFIEGLVCIRYYRSQRDDSFPTYHELLELIGKIDTNTLISKIHQESVLDEDSHNSLLRFLRLIGFFADESGNEKIIEALIKYLEPSKVRYKFNIGKYTSKFQETAYAYSLESQLTSSILWSISDRLVNDFIDILLPKLCIEHYSLSLLNYVLPKPIPTKLQYTFVHRHFTNLTNHNNYQKLLNSIKKRLNLLEIISGWSSYVELRFIIPGIIFIGDKILSNEDTTILLIGSLSEVIDYEQDLNLIIHTFNIIARKKKSGINVINKIADKIDKNLFKEKLVEQKDSLKVNLLHLVAYPNNKNSIKQVFDKLNLWALLSDSKKKNLTDYLESQIDYSKFKRLCMSDISM